MAFTIQNDLGTVAGANAYLSVADFKAYCDDRGMAYSSYADPVIEKAIVKATDYIDRRFRYKSVRLQTSGQRTQWPRLDVFDADSTLIHGIPQAVKDACAEYAHRALSTTLLADPSREDNGQQVSMKSETVGPITETTQYSGSGFQLPRYPTADMILTQAGLVVVGNTVVRG
jgi:hypothetical protein